jgi:hypothetical protein
MTGERIKHVALAAGFLTAIFSIAAAQVGIELGRGERPRIAGLFRKAPTEANLRALEKQLDNACWFSGQLRPWVQYAQFIVLGDCGERAVMGRDGWFFYKPEVQYLIERERGRESFSGEGERVGGTVSEEDSRPLSPVSAIVSFRDQLAARGIALLVVPAPNKTSVYPEMLVARAGAEGGSGGSEAGRGKAKRCPRHTQELLAQLEAAGVEVVDLFAVFEQAKAGGPQHDSRALYLAQDTHWSPEGVQLAARAVAQKVLERNWVARGSVHYDMRPIAVSRHGDILEMMQVPQIERHFPPEEITCRQVILREKGVGSLFPGEIGGVGESPRKKSSDPFFLYRDDPASPVLVLGDSFLRIYQQDEPRSAGFIAHLARELGLPVASLVNDGGGSTLVRQDLSRKPGLLAGKKLVIWEFVERDIRFGTEGWQEVPLPPGIRNPKPEIRNESQ